MLNFDIRKRQEGTGARTGIIHSSDRTIQTPELAIVATDAKLRSLPNVVLKDLPSTYFIVNTYHTYTKKIIPLI